MQSQSAKNLIRSLNRSNLNNKELLKLVNVQVVYDYFIHILRQKYRRFSVFQRPIRSSEKETETRKKQDKLRTYLEQNSWRITHLGAANPFKDMKQLYHFVAAQKPNVPLSYSINQLCPRNLAIPHQIYSLQNPL